MIWLLLAIIGFAVGYVIGLQDAESSRRLRLSTQRNKLNVHRWQRLPNGELEIETTDGKIYRGEITVWHCYPSGDRCSLNMEKWLSEREQAIKWQEQEKETRRLT